MQQSQTMIVKGAAAQFVLGGLVLALMTAVLFALHADLAIAALTSLVVIAMVALRSSLAVSVLLSVAAALGLDYFFAQPAFNFTIEDPRDASHVAVFLVTALVVAWLTGNVRKVREAQAVETALRRRQAELQDLEQQWREVFEHNPVMYFMLDAEGRVINANTLAATQLGYSVQDLIGQPVLKVFHTEEHALVRKCLAACVDAIDQPFTWELQKVRRDGSRLWVRENAKAMRRADGRLVILIACEDITARKEAETALQRSQAYLAHAQELSRTGSFGWIVSTGEIFWSNETFRIFGYDPAVVRPSRQVILDRAHPEDRADVDAVIGQAARDHADFEHEYRIVLPDGAVKHLHAVARATINGAGQLEFVGSATDVTIARESEAKLRRIEAYLAEAQRLSHTSSWAWDMPGRAFIYRSPEFFRLFGFDPDDGVPVEAIQERIPLEDRQMQVEMIRRARVEGQGDLEFDFRVLLPDGSTKRVHSLAHPVRNANGQVIELVGTHVDVTEQYVAREKLEHALAEIKNSEDRLRLVIDTIPALVWRTRSDGAAEFFNQPCLDYTGLSMEQSLAWGWTSAIHPDDVDHLLGTWYTTRLAGQSGEAEARLRRFDGVYRWFLFRMQPLRDEGHKIRMWYGSATDIEDRKQTEDALRESEQRFRDYAETASDWLWETGPDHRMTQFAEHKRTGGILATGVIGLLRWQIASNPDVDPEKWREHREMLDAHIPFRDLVYRTEDSTGAQIFVRTSGKPFFDAAGNFLGYRGVSTDITAVIRADEAELALRKAQGELAHVTRVTTLGELTASIAHEINQPLAAVVANADACLSWLDRSPPDLAAARRSIEWIVDDANRASEVIRRVRALAKKSDIERAALDVNVLVREAMALVQRELSRNDVALRMELAPGLPSIYGDRVQLQQVIINLVMNGIEAMQSVGDRPRRLAVRSGQDERGRVCLTVADCGVGIADADAERIFTPFFTTKSSGMGMGLAICRSILEAHEGRLSAFRNEEGGATFQCVLPLRQEDAA